MLHTPRSFVAITLIAIACSSLSAHEFWIGPIEVIEPGAVPLRLFVGDGLPGSVFPRDPRHIERFFVLGPGAPEPVPVVGLAGSDPAGWVRLTEPGLYVAAYRSRATPIEIEAPRFNAYLVEEGLDDALRLRERLGEGDGPGRELYSRCAKTIFEVAGGRRHGHDRQTGLRLELIPEDDPLGLGVGDELTLRAVLEGETLAGLTLHAFHDGSTRAVARVRTDAAGRARFTLNDAGTWMISGVHMTRSSRPGFEWESTWTSLTFVLP